MNDVIRFDEFDVGTPRKICHQGGCIFAARVNSPDPLLIHYLCVVDVFGPLGGKDGRCSRGFVFEQHLTGGNFVTLKGFGASLGKSC